MGISTDQVMKRSRMLLGCAALLFGAFHSANAAVIQTHDSVFGNQSVIRDVTNSREFLQLVHTMGRVGDVPSQLGLGGDFEGWSIATGSDIQALFTSAGITSFSTDPGQIAIAEQLRDWFCIRGAISCVRLTSVAEYARGLVSDQTLHPPSYDAWSFGRRFNVSPEEVMAYLEGFGPGDDDEAMYLVRTVAATVPVPNTALLLGLGLAVLWARRART